MARPLSEHNTEANRKLVVRALELGLSVNTAAALIGGTRDVIYGWRRRDESFDEDCRVAAAKGKVAVATQLMRKIQEGNLQAIMFWLRTRTDEFREAREALVSEAAESTPDRRYV
tara:strand:- start:655 stop:999 length:345 start_codon:yes stop_codon:yes gene_type:complete